MDKILAFVDFSDATSEVVRTAGSFARAFKAKVWLVHVVDPESDYDGDTLRADVSRGGMAREMRARRRALELAAMALGKLGAGAVARVVRGAPIRKALRKLNRLNPDLVIVGTSQRGRLHRLLQGSVGAALARKAHCPVLVVPQQPPASTTGFRPAP